MKKHMYHSGLDNRSYVKDADDGATGASSDAEINDQGFEIDNVQRVPTDKFVRVYTPMTGSVSVYSNQNRTNTTGVPSTDVNVLYKSIIYDDQNKDTIDTSTYVTDQSKSTIYSNSKNRNNGFLVPSNDIKVRFKPTIYSNESSDSKGVPVPVDQSIIDKQFKTTIYNNESSRINGVSDVPYTNQNVQKQETTQLPNTNVPASNHAFGSDGKYEPYDHGNTVHSLGYWGALLHMMKYIIGTGILSIPYCYMKVGYLIAIPLTLILSLLYVHVIQVLLKTEYELCKRDQVPSLSYVEVVQRAFAPYPKIQVPVVGLIYFNYVFNGVVGNASYLLIIGTNLQSLCQGVFGLTMNVHVYVAYAMAPLIAICLIPKLSFLVPLSTFTNLFNAINIVLILYIPSQGTSQSNSSLGTAANGAVPYVGFRYVPQFTGMYLGAMSATGLIFPVKNDMRHPHQFGAKMGVFNMCALVSTTIYSIFGLLAYFKYGDAIQGLILSNLPDNMLISQMVFTMYTVAVCVSFTLCFYIIFDTIWVNYLRQKMETVKARNGGVFSRAQSMRPAIIKVTLNLITVALAMVIPKIELFIAFFGSFSTICELAIPCVLQSVLIISKPAKSNSSIFLPWMIVAKNMIIISLSLYICVSSLIESTRDIAQYYQHNSEVPIHL